MVGLRSEARSGGALKDPGVLHDGCFDDEVRKG